MKRILLALILVLMIGFYSCRTIDDYAKKVELGMTQQQVTKIMGNRYTRSASFLDEDGKHVDILRFTNAVSYPYMLTFEDGRLVEMYQDIPHHYPHVVQPPQPMPYNNRDTDKK